MQTKNVLITGTSTGIGAASVKRLAAAGWKVYACVRKPEDGEQFAATSGVTPVIMDVTNSEQVDQVLTLIEQEDGCLHALVNNAGLSMGGPVELLPEERLRDTFEVNFFGPVALTRKAMTLVNKVDGRFIHVGSIAGRVGAVGGFAYCGSKYALEGFNWSLRMDLKNTGMTSSIIEPGAIITSMWEKQANLTSDVEKLLDTPQKQSRYGFMVPYGKAYNKLGKNTGIPADDVAKVIEKVLTVRKPRARYLVGPDAKIVGRILARLPDVLLEKILCKHRDKMIAEGQGL